MNDLEQIVRIAFSDDASPQHAFAWFCAYRLYRWYLQAAIYKDRISLPF